MFRISSFSACSFGLLAFALAAPANAQPLSTKDAWDVLASFVSGAGGSLTTTGLQREGAALLAPHAVLRMGEALELRFDTIRLEPRGDDVAVIPSASFGAVSNWGQPGERRDYAIAHDGSLLLSADLERAGLELDFSSFAVTKTAATRNGEPITESFSMVLSGLAGRLGMTLEEPISLRGDLRASGMDYDFTMASHPIPMTQTARSRTEDLRISISVDGLRRFETTPGWVRRAFAEGLSARARFENGRSESHVEQEVFGNRTVFAGIVAGSDGEIVVADGMLTVEGEAENFVMDIEMMEVAGAATLGRLGMGMEMPVVSGPDNRPFRMALTLDEVSLAAPLLAMFGAEGFAEDQLSATLDVQGNGRWLIEITDNPDTDDIPFDFSSFELNSLGVRIGDSALTGEGQFTLAPGSFGAATEGIPEGEGDFVFELRGGDALLGRLAAAGLIPPDQQFLARMMMNALGRSVGEDHLRSEVAIRPGGQLTVNGLPLPF